jgi:hypothetical protein
MTRGIAETRALELAQDRGRGRGILSDWWPPEPSSVARTEPIPIVLGCPAAKLGGLAL